ncbi:MAG: 3-deoxy-manno-octulosonate cytidylyltransferase, partial [Candidatus Nitrotoga sp.]
RAVAQHLHDHPDCAIATACHPINDDTVINNPNVVKVVLDKHDNALYFSRAAIPFARDAETVTRSMLRHIGIYAYRAGFLRDFCQLPPATIEQTEALEQLRALWHGYKIGVTITDDAPPGGVDTEQDLQIARERFVQI